MVLINVWSNLKIVAVRLKPNGDPAESNACLRLILGMDRWETLCGIRGKTFGEQIKENLEFNQ